jgi:hydrogenase maturation protein HypF
MIEKSVNTPLTSSMGRLFDAVSSLLSIRDTVNYEGQAAIELEMLAPDEFDETGLMTYPFTIIVNSGVRVIKLDKLFQAVIQDIRNRVPVSQISLTIHNTVARMTVEMCQLIKRDTGLHQVALSGGVFQNRLLLRLVMKRLEEADFQVLTHHLVPCNDGGIALGQVVVANFI